MGVHVKLLDRPFDLGLAVRGLGERASEHSLSNYRLIDGSWDPCHCDCSAKGAECCLALGSVVPQTEPAQR